MSSAKCLYRPVEGWDGLSSNLGQFKGFQGRAPFVFNIIFLGWSTVSTTETAMFQRLKHVGSRHIEESCLPKTKPLAPLQWLSKALVLADFAQLQKSPRCSGNLLRIQAYLIQHCLGCCLSPVFWPIVVVVVVVAGGRILPLSLQQPVIPTPIEVSRGIAIGHAVYCFSYPSDCYSPSTARKLQTITRTKKSLAWGFNSWLLQAANSIHKSLSLKLRLSQNGIFYEPHLKIIFQTHQSKSAIFWLWTAPCSVVAPRDLSKLDFVVGVDGFHHQSRALAERISERANQIA